MSLFSGVPLQEKILFTKNLSLTLKAGVPLVNGLKMFAQQTKNKNFKKILETLIDDTNKGVFLSASLAKYSKVFGDLFINIIKVAEVSGTLPENLLYLGVELEKKATLRKRVKGAMVYPMVILFATVVIATSMILFVFPKILPLFNSLGAELPLTTRILIAVSDVVTNQGIWLLVGVIALFILTRFALSIKAIRYVYHQMLFYVPVFGHSIINYNMANFARTLGLLLKSGVKIIEAISVSGASLNNLVYKRELEKAGEAVRKGEFLSKYLEHDSKRFPPTLVNMIEVGENTGNLTENLFYLSEYYENELDDFVKNLSGILEPILLIFMGGIVGFIALSFITPIYELTRSVR